MSEVKFWLTSHWPPLKGERPSAGVWIKEGKEAAGKDLRPGDPLLIYETGSGPSELITNPDGSTTRRRRERGRERIIMIAEVDEKLDVDRISTLKEYVGRTKPIWWKWFASATKISESGFVLRKDVNRVLRNKSGRMYKSSYNFHGFGDLQSGLKQIDETEYHALVKKFHSKARPLPIVEKALKIYRRRKGGRPKGESPEHRNLKNFVFNAPVAALGVEGLTSVAKEYGFLTDDRADVVLKDRSGNIVGVEVERHVDDTDLEGPLQAIKYRSMLELVTGHRRGDGRAFLVAYRISKRMRRLCAEYGVECFEVKANKVEEWRKSGSRGDT